MKSRRKIFTPIALSLGAAAAVMVVTVLGAAAGMNAQSLTRQTALLNNGLAGRVQEINHQVVTQVVWDEAIEHLDNQFDPQWAKSNIGTFFSATDGFDGATVLDPADRPIYAMRDGLDVDPGALGKPSAAAIPLIAWVRRAESNRRAPGPGDWTRLMKAPIQASAFAKVDGHLQLITATLVQPDFGHVVPTGPHAPIVVTIKLLDAPFVASLGDRFLLKDLHIATSGEAGGVALTGPGGETLGRMTWTPDRPGETILRNGAPLVALFLGLIALTAFALMRQARLAAEELIASEARANQLAMQDCLTGLPNRRLFTDQLAQALQQARRANRQMAILQVEFRRPAASGVGVDEWVEQVAARLRETCRGSDTLARLGGETFAVIQPDGTASSGAALSERIKAAFKAPVRVSAGPQSTALAIGVAVAPEGEMAAADLIRQGEVALTRARELGDNHYCFFEPEMDAALRLRRELESDLRQALIDDALEVHYQPQFDSTGAVVGLEALARWNHPLRGMISPAIFVQIAEESRLIGPLGLFTLKRALEDSVRWKHLKVAINMSSCQINLPGLADDLRALLAKFELPGGNFELEINEAVLLENNEHIHAVVRRIKAQGLTVALDNFGAGHSSLGQLRRYPIDKIKIDRSFVAELGVDPEADAVISAMIKLAEAFELKITAEGVETEAQWQRLRALGCPAAQGFLFSRPLPPEQMEVFLKAAAQAVGA